jgi:hypothetical protein
VTQARPARLRSVRVNDDSTLTRVSSIAAGEAAKCSIVRVGDTLYASNAGSGTLSEVRDAPGEPFALLGAVGGEGIVAG